jgi:predicted metal-dependent phosphoesterase TrpH
MRCLVDLHTHSSASDGTDSPEELAAGAMAAGLAAIALTDHDTLSGLAAARAAGAAQGLEVIPGVELAVSSPYGEIHLLGLWLPPETPRLAKALEAVRAAREVRNRLLLEKLRAGGIAVSYEELLAFAGGESVGRPHIARLLTARGCCRSPQEAFASLLGEKGRLHVPRALPTPEEGLRMLKDEGAVTVFAHPMLLKAPQDWLKKITGDLRDMGLDAVEAYHPEHTPAGEHFCEQLARRYGLALSGGSDYHGKAKPDVALGRGRGKLRVPYALLRGLRERKT